MYIELVDKIIKIPPTNKYLVAGENNPQKFIFKIPKNLTTINKDYSKIFLLWKLNSNETVEEELEYLMEDLEYLYFKRNITLEQTLKEGTLTIQIKILRNIDTVQSEEIDPEFFVSSGYEENGFWYSFQNSFIITSKLQ